MPGPKPIPTYLKLLRGNPGHQKLNKGEPQPAQTPEVPKPPDFLVGYACDEWFRVAPQLHVLGLLSILDLMPLAAYCASYSHWRTAEEALARMAEKDPVTGALLIKGSFGEPRENPLVRAAERAAGDMIRFAGEFGMTPSARARVAAGIAWREDGGKFDGLLG
jgi:P27 family predicted phage terminase small subunit